MTAQPTRATGPASTTQVEPPAASDVLQAPAPGAPEPRPGLWTRLGDPPRKPLWIGFAAALLLLVGGLGGGGDLIHDPLLTNSPLGFWRYGHGRELATAVMYLGVAMMAWAWVILGRAVIARKVGGRGVLATAVLWTLPMLVAPPLFTRDVYSYLAQGALPLFGFDPYAVGPLAMPGVLTDNVHYFWQSTPAPYGPLFILVAKAWAWVVVQSGYMMILGVIGMRLIMFVGWLLLVRSLPELTRRMGGRPAVALWVIIANPVMVIHMVGGGHNDLLLVGLLAVGCLLALRGRHVWAIVLVTMAMATKASAAVALPFIVLVWAATLEGPFWKRLLKAGGAGFGLFVLVFAAISAAAQVGLGWIPALSAPSMIVNWLSIPTGLGQLAFNVLNGLIHVGQQTFINIGRVIGAIALVALVAWQWWKAREGGPEAIRRAGIALLAVALLTPTTLPWYLSWGMALLAMTAWSARGLQWLVFVSLWLMVVFYPDGEAALYNWGYLIVCAIIAALFARSLLRPDPLGLARRRPAPAVPETAVPARAQPGGR